MNHPKRYLYAALIVQVFLALAVAIYRAKAQDSGEVELPYWEQNPEEDLTLDLQWNPHLLIVGDSVADEIRINCQTGEVEIKGYENMSEASQDFWRQLARAFPFVREEMCK